MQMFGVGVGALDFKEHQLDASRLICIPYIHRRPPAPARRRELSRSSTFYGAAGGAAANSTEWSPLPPPILTASDGPVADRYTTALSLSHIETLAFSKQSGLLPPAEVFRADCLYNCNTGITSSR